MLWIPVNVCGDLTSRSLHIVIPTVFPAPQPSVSVADVYMHYARARRRRCSTTSQRDRRSNSLFYVSSMPSTPPAPSTLPADHHSLLEPSDPEKNLGRKAPVNINATIGLWLALRYTTTSYFQQAWETFGSTQIMPLLSPFLHEVLVDSDIVLHTSSSKSIGRLASLSGTNFLTGQIKD